MHKITITNFTDRMAREWNALMGCSPRILGGFPVDFLLAVALAICLGVWPTNWLFKLFLLLVLGIILAELTWRWLPRLGGSGKVVASALTFMATIAMGYGPVEDQYNIDAVFRDYKTTRDLIAKFQVHDASIKKIVEQYDRMKEAQWLFDSWRGKTDENQHAEINKHNIEDLKNVLNNYEAIATPAGAGLKIKLGLNLFHVVYPVPMRMLPSVSFSALPRGTTVNIIEQSNLGCTFLFLPLSVAVDTFNLGASAEP